MFGFPFFTSLVVVIAGVVVASLLVNKGITKRAPKQANRDSALAEHQRTMS